ncbi:hypothetical protein ACR77J_07575 [Tissierella praeacuta]|uniref:hypothetical protein n=1 Tax=Tissierella praeacuta TaxID=43131 RepID=UPI003DA66D20
MKKCVFCNSKLVYKDYSSYYDPPEWYLRCKRCKKFEMSYFYYDGYYLKLDKWERSNVDVESPIMKEFYKRLKYYRKRK